MTHRHLIGIPSPPDDHQPDNITLGPVLPNHWNGDAWKREKANDNSYWLRAWNKSTSRFAIAQADTYEAARQLLQEDIAKGGTGKVTITVTEHKSK